MTIMTRVPLPAPLEDAHLSSLPQNLFTKAKLGDPKGQRSVGMYLSNPSVPLPFP